MKLSQLTCSICRKPIPIKGTWSGGNSAEPINDGRCCDDCDMRYVLPARMRQERLFERLRKEHNQ